MRVFAVASADGGAWIVKVMGCVSTVLVNSFDARTPCSEFFDFPSSLNPADVTVKIFLECGTSGISFTATFPLD